MTRSPIVLEHARLVLLPGRWTGRWKVTGDLSAAVFRCQTWRWKDGQKEPAWRWGLLHPSSKRPDRWQFTTFDGCGPTGDDGGDTAHDALQRGTGGGYDGWGGNVWRLRGVVLADGTKLGNPELPSFGCADDQCLVCTPTVYRCCWCNGPFGIDRRGRLYGSVRPDGTPVYPGCCSQACASRGGLHIRA